MIKWILIEIILIINNQTIESDNNIIFSIILNRKYNIDDHIPIIKKYELSTDSKFIRIKSIHFIKKVLYL